MKQIDSAMLDALSQKAGALPRKRTNFNLHSVPDDPVQRLCIAIEPGTYIRPHRHAKPETGEVFLLLRGSAVLLLFNDSGEVMERAVLSALGPVIAAEIPSKAWHAMASLERGTVFFEVKQGPYVPPAGGDVAVWASAEGEQGTAQFVEWYLTAKVGDMPPMV